MSYHQYKCKKCNCEFELEIGLLEGQYFLRIQFSPEEEEEMWAKGIDPRFEETELPLKEIPMSPPCMQCDSEETEKIMHDFTGVVKGFSVTAYHREMDFYKNGYNKQQALNFYKESIEASKERMKSGGEHYKHVVPDMKYMRKMGLAKKSTDKDIARKTELFKNLNVKLADNAKKLPKETIK